MNPQFGIKKIWRELAEFLSDTENPEEPQYDPVHVGAMLVIVFFSITLLFWLLWSLLVFGGGIQAKIMPLLQVIFTNKTAADFGYVGYPYAMGVFEGWITNCVALVLVILLIYAAWRLFTSRAGTHPGK